MDVHLTALIAALSLCPMQSLWPGQEAPGSDQAVAKERKPLEMGDLPLPVQNTIRGQAGNEAVERIEPIRQEGENHYKAVFKKEGKPVEVWVDAKGRLIQSPPRPPLPERAPLAAPTKMTLSELPKAVQDRLRSITASQTTFAIDKGTVQGQTVYDVAFQQNGERIELRIGQDGKMVADRQNQRALAKLGKVGETKPAQGTTEAGRPGSP